MKLVCKTLLAGLAAAAIAGPASATVVTFDDLTGSGVVADGYGGINWGGLWNYYDSDQYPYTPASGKTRVYDYGAGDGFSFDTARIFDGAWFAGQSSTTVQFELWSGGGVVATSAILSLSDVPHYLTPAYSGLVDKVVVLSNAPDFFVMDDVTYHGGAGGVPEPATWAMMILGFGAIGMTMRGQRRVAVKV